MFFLCIIPRKLASPQGEFGVLKRRRTWKRQCLEDHYEFRRLPFHQLLRPRNNPTPEAEAEAEVAVEAEEVQIPIERYKIKIVVGFILWYIVWMVEKDQEMVILGNILFCFIFVPPKS